MCLFPLDLVSFLNVGQRMMLHEVFTILSPPKVFIGQRRAFKNNMAAKRVFDVNETSVSVMCFTFHLNYLFFRDAI